MIGALAWSGAFIVVGYVLGAQWRALMQGYGLGAILIGVGALTVAGAVAIVVVRLARRRRHGPARRAAMTGRA